MTTLERTILEMIEEAVNAPAGISAGWSHAPGELSETQRLEWGRQVMVQLLNGGLVELRIPDVEIDLRVAIYGWDYYTVVLELDEALKIIDEQYRAGSPMSLAAISGERPAYSHSHTKTWATEKGERVFKGGQRP